MRIRRREFAKSMTALDEVFGFLTEFIEAEGIGSRSAFSLNLIAEELFTNMVKYGGGTSPRISLALGRTADQVELRLTDEGAEPFDPGALDPVDTGAPIEQRRRGGLGLHIVKTIADEVRFEFLDPGMTILVTKTLERSHV